MNSANTPKVTTPDLIATSDSGISDSDNLTNDITPSFSGTAGAGSSIELFADGISLGSSITDSNSNWTYTVEDDSPLTDGSIAITATTTKTTSDLERTAIPVTYPGRSLHEVRNQGAFAALKDDGSVVTWGDINTGGDSSSVDLGLSSGVNQIFSSYGAFAALKDDGSVVTWGDNFHGGYSNNVAAELSSGVNQISSARKAFAALKDDGSVVTWGDSRFGGGGNSSVDLALSSGVKQIFSSAYAFAALKDDGSVVTWGSSNHGGDSSSVANEISSGVNQIFSTDGGAFAALKGDGAVITWGSDFWGGDSSSVDIELSTGVNQIFSTDGAFAALKDDGSVVTWGNNFWGGDSSNVDIELSTGVNQIFSTDGAFAALKDDGAVVTWGLPESGGNSENVDLELNSGVNKIFSTYRAFAALKNDSSVVTWGTAYGGDSSSVELELKAGVTHVFSNVGAFAAVKDDGSIVSWGSSEFGGDSSSVADQISSGVNLIFSTDYAFAALKDDGSVVTWGSSNNGGDSSSVAADLSSGVVSFADPFHDDRLVSITSTSDPSDPLNLTIDSTAPAFSSGEITSQIDEKSGPAQAIYYAIADDASGITYSIKQNNSDDAASFTIDASTGKVILNDNPDHEIKPSYSFSITANDFAGNTAEKNITLGITDQPPVVKVVNDAKITLGQRHTDISGGDYLKLGYALKGNDNTGNPGGEASTLGVNDHGLTNVAVLGPNTSSANSFTLEISAESLKEGWNLESTDIVLKYNADLFDSITAADITLASELPIKNAISIDDENGLIRFAAASLSNISDNAANPADSSINNGSAITVENILASINVNFDESYFNDTARNPDANGKFTFEGNPLGFELVANSDETIFSRNFDSDADGNEVTGGAFTNREIKSLGDLNGNTIFDKSDVNLYQAEIKFDEQDDGLTFGTKRVIGANQGFTNLIRQGDTVTAQTSIENVGNSLAQNVTISDAGLVENAEFVTSRFKVPSPDPTNKFLLEPVLYRIAANGSLGDSIDLKEIAQLEAGTAQRVVVEATDTRDQERKGLVAVDLDVTLSPSLSLVKDSPEISREFGFKRVVTPSSSGLRIQGSGAPALGSSFGSPVGDQAKDPVLTFDVLVNEPNQRVVIGLSTGNSEDRDGLLDRQATLLDESNSIIYSLDNTDKSSINLSGGIFKDNFSYDASKQESVDIEVDMKVTGAAGSVIDVTKGLFQVTAAGMNQNPDTVDTPKVFVSESGSKNLITFQGDLNYDGRVSMKDLAFLNAGAARQVENNGVIDTASVARDVDADFSGKIDIADLSILDNDWGKSLHTGTEDFTGSSDTLNWTSLAKQDSAEWDNSSFTAQNAIEAQDSYIGSLESPTSTGIIGADGNTGSNDGDLLGTEVQEPLAA